MSFTRANPGGWSTGALFTAAQANQMDSNQSNALDKTLSGDTLYGSVSMSSFGAILVNTSGAQINSSVSAGLVSSVAGGFMSTAVGGFQLAGGPTDWPTFSASRSRSQVWPLLPVASLAGAWTASSTNPNLTGNASGTQQAFFMPGLHNGATLSTVTVYLSVAGPHAVSYPANPPSIVVVRYKMAGAVTSSPLSTSSSQGFTPWPPASGTAWDDGGAIQALVFTCNENNVVDTTQYTYVLVLSDENGLHSVTGNVYVGVQYGYTAIPNMAFP